MKKLPIMFLFIITTAAITVGYLAYRSMSIKTEPQQTNLPSAFPTPTAVNPSTTWKTYTNNSLGLSLKYPGDWETKPAQVAGNPGLHGLIGLYPPNFNIPQLNNLGLISITYWDNPNNLSIQQFDEPNPDSGMNRGLYSAAAEPMTIGGIPGFYNKNQGCSPFGCKKYIIAYANKIFEIDIFTDFGKETDYNVANQILSTLQFAGSKSVSAPTPPTGWKSHVFSSQDLTIYTPSDWNSNIQNFPSSSVLIKFWKSSSPSIVPIQLEIKPNWDNTGDAQYLTKNYTVAGSIPALKIDPPDKTTPQERYQTNVFFEYGGKVFVFECVHNWTADYVSTCNTMLETMRFSK